MSTSVVSAIQQYFTSDRLHKFMPAIRIKTVTYRFHPTLYGVIFFGMLTALLIGSINHNNNLGYLLTFLLSSMFLVSIMLTYRNLRNITVSGGNGRPVFAGQTTRFNIHLQAREGKRYGVVAALDHHHRQQLNLTHNLAASTQLALPAKSRGILQVNRIFLSTSFPLGLFTWRTEAPVSLSCLVYPTPIAGPLHTETGTGSDEDQHQQERSKGKDFSGLLAYKPGDTPRQIHWKSLAGGKGLHSKFFEEQTSGSSLFSLQDIPGKDLEFKLSRLCQMILTADARGIPFGLRLGSQLLEPSQGAPHTSSCLKALSLYGQ
ncbi:DUF58 domain-containing protein [Desulfogranum japonicum]|uniref:DUF58 domain-containing protein n=1 Tax=Desulfogranum japonicum TaxID=231447 RepID=UPI0004051011|nr:DUF58 domain-containing protein [Desulfogranum japonicum]